MKVFIVLIYLGLMLGCVNQYIPSHKNVWKIEYSHAVEPPHVRGLSVGECAFFCDTPFNYAYGGQRVYYSYYHKDSIKHIVRDLQKIHFTPYPLDWYAQVKKNPNCKDWVESEVKQTNISFLYPATPRRFNLDSTKIFGFHERIIFYKKEGINDTFITAGYVLPCRKTTLYGYKSAVSFKGKLYEESWEIVDVLFHANDKPFNIFRKPVLVISAKPSIIESDTTSGWGDGINYEPYSYYSPSGLEAFRQWRKAKIEKFQRQYCGCGWERQQEK